MIKTPKFRWPKRLRFWKKKAKKEKGFLGPASVTSSSPSVEGSAPDVPLSEGGVGASGPGGEMTSFASRPSSSRDPTKKRAAPKRSSRSELERSDKAVLKKAVESESSSGSSRRRSGTSSRDADAGSVPEHRKMAQVLRKLEAEGRKGSAQYKELAAKHGVALHKRLKSLGCDLTDAKLRTLNKPDAGWDKGGFNGTSTCELSDEHVSQGTGLLFKRTRDER